MPSNFIKHACRNGSGPISPCSKSDGRIPSPHAAPEAVRGWPCASTAAGHGDPRHRSPGCRRGRTRPRHIEDEGGVAVTQRMAAASAHGVVFPDLPGCTAMGRTVDKAHAGSDRQGAAAHVCGVDVQLTRPRSEPPIVRQAIEITGSTEPPLFVTDVRKALAQGTRREA